MIYLFILSDSGKVKKVSYRDIHDGISKIPSGHRGIHGLKIAYSVRKVILLHEGSKVLAFTEDGFAAVLDPDEFRSMGLGAEGITAMRGKKVVDILEDPEVLIEIKERGFEND